MDFFKANGFEITYSSLINQNADSWFYNPGHLVKKIALITKSVFKRYYEIFTVHRYDIVFVQREAIMLGTSFFERRLAKKCKLIYDFDDSIWLLDVSEANKKFGWLKKPEKTGEIISVSTAVFAGNDYLAEYASQFNKNVIVVPTVLKTENIDFLYSNKPKNDKIVIGWIGSTTTIKHIEWALPMLEELFSAFKNQIQLVVISDKKPLLPTIDFQFVLWSPESEKQLLTSMDIGIMPIPDDNWTRGKCGFKGLQCMSFGIPVVMSAVGVNNQIINHGENGYLANSNEDWLNSLSKLINDVSLRNEIGKNGKSTVDEQYALEKWQAKVVEIFNEITKN
jgi:glycosyltransferase involved in cell wall biosynthesis